MGGCVSVPVKSQSAKICLNVNFWDGVGGERGGVCSVPGKSQSAKICLIFNGGGGGCPVPNPRTGCSCQFEPQILPCHFVEAFASQIGSHILHMWRLINVYKYVNQKRLGYHAGRQEVTRCCTKGESEDSIPLIDPLWL